MFFYQVEPSLCTKHVIIELDIMMFTNRPQSKPHETPSSFYIFKCVLTTNYDLTFLGNTIQDEPNFIKCHAWYQCIASLKGINHRIQIIESDEIISKLATICLNYRFERQIQRINVQMGSLLWGKLWSRENFLLSHCVGISNMLMKLVYSRTHVILFNLHL